jgi:hypothetical protein
MRYRNSTLLGFLVFLCVSGAAFGAPPVSRETLFLAENSAAMDRMMAAMAVAPPAMWMPISLPR